MRNTQPQDLATLIENGVQRDLAFDDDPIEAILYRNAPKNPTPTDVIQIWREGEEISDECARALASILSNHTEEFRTLHESLPQSQFEGLLNVLLPVLNTKGSFDAGFLQSFIDFLEQLGRLVEACELREAQFHSRLEASPQDSDTWNQYAMFLKNERNDYGGAERAYRKALQLAPKDPTVLANMAVLQATILQRYDEAETLYQESIRLDDKNATTFGNFAFFQQNVRRDLDRAEELYRRAISLNAGDTWIPTNYATLLLCRNQRDEARQVVSRIWNQLEKRQGRLSARLLYIQSALDRLEGRDIRLYIGQLKTLFARGIGHVPWIVTTMQELLREILSLSDFEFFYSLSRAIDDRNAVKDLDQFELWRTSDPVSLDASWPD